MVFTFYFYFLMWYAMNNVDFKKKNKNKNEAIRKLYDRLSENKKNKTK